MGTTPFKVLYGHGPRHFGILDTIVYASDDLATWLQERGVVTELLRQHLQRANQRMKVQADKKRSRRVFAEGDWVYLKIQPYVQTSLAHRSDRKLGFRYFGPFQVLQRIGVVAYKLKLPAGCAIHPVIHVSQLKRGLPPTTPVQASPPPC